MPGPPPLWRHRWLYQTVRSFFCKKKKSKWNNPNYQIKLFVKLFGACLVFLTIKTGGRWSAGSRCLLWRCQTNYDVTAVISNQPDQSNLKTELNFKPFEWHLIFLIHFFLFENGMFSLLHGLCDLAWIVTSLSAFIYNFISTRIMAIVDNEFESIWSNLEAVSLITNISDSLFFFLFCFVLFWKRGFESFGQSAEIMTSSVAFYWQSNHYWTQELCWGTIRGSNLQIRSDLIDNQGLKFDILVARRRAAAILTSSMPSLGTKLIHAKMETVNETLSYRCSTCEVLVSILSEMNGLPTPGHWSIGGSWRWWRHDRITLGVASG